MKSGKAGIGGRHSAEGTQPRTKHTDSGVPFSMSAQNSVAIVHAFWDAVWNAHDPAAVHRFVTDDFVIVTGGETISGRENFKTWIEGFLAKVDDLHLEVVESFQNADGSRVVSRWVLTGRNNGILGTAPDK